MRRMQTRWRMTGEGEGARRRRRRIGTNRAAADVDLRRGGTPLRLLCSEMVIRVPTDVREEARRVGGPIRRAHLTPSGG